LRSALVLLMSHPLWLSKVYWGINLVFIITIWWTLGRILVLTLRSSAIRLVSLRIQMMLLENLTWILTSVHITLGRPTIRVRKVGCWIPVKGVV
jgi:hypothetical protein